MWSYLVVFATLTGAIFSAINLECKCYEDANAVKTPDGCHGNKSLTTTTYTMTTSNCTVIITINKSDIQNLADLTLFVDIGVECDLALQPPLTDCPTTFCSVRQGQAGFPINGTVSVAQKGILKLTIDWISVNINYDYKVEVVCLPLDTGSLLIKTLNVVFSDAMTNAILSTKSATEILTHTPAIFLSVMSTVSHKTQTMISRNENVSTTPMKLITQTSTSEKTQNRKSDMAVSTTSTLASVITATNRSILKSVDPIFTSTTALRHLEQNTPLASFFDNPVNVILVSAVSGVATVSVAGVGISLLLLRFCKPRQVISSPSTNADEEEENM